MYETTFLVVFSSLVRLAKTYNLIGKLHNSGLGRPNTGVFRLLSVRG